MAKSRYHHKQVKDMCFKLYQGMKNATTWETQVWRQLYLMSELAVWPYVTAEWNANWASKTLASGKPISLYSWLYDDFSNDEWRWTKFLWEAETYQAEKYSAPEIYGFGGVARDIEAFDGIPAGKTYREALPLVLNSWGWASDTIRDAPLGNDVITVVWQARQCYGLEKTTSVPGTSAAITPPKPGEPIAYGNIKFFGNTNYHPEFPDGTKNVCLSPILSTAQGAEFRYDIGLNTTWGIAKRDPKLGFSYYPETLNSEEEKNSPNMWVKSSGEYANRNEVWVEAQKTWKEKYRTVWGNDEHGDKGETYYIDGEPVEKEPMVHRFYPTKLFYGGKPVWRTITDVWSIVWVDIKGHTCEFSYRINSRSRKKTTKSVKLSPVKGWVMVIGDVAGLGKKGEESAAEADMYNDPTAPGTLAWTISRTRAGADIRTDPGDDVGYTPFKWRMLGSHATKPGFVTRKVDPYKADGSVGNFSFPGKVVTWPWTAYDKAQTSAKERGEWEHSMGYRMARNCWKHLYNSNPEKLYKYLISCYSTCPTYPNIIERLMYCYYYFFPLTRYAGDDGTNTYSGFEGGDYDEAGSRLKYLQKSLHDSKLVGKGRGSHHRVTHHDFDYWRCSLKQAIQVGRDRDKNDANKKWWDKCEHVASYAGEITWSETSSYGDTVTLGPKKVWGSHSIRATKKTKADAGWEKEGDIIPEAMKTKFSDGYGWIDPFWEWKWANSQGDNIYTDKDPNSPTYGQTLNGTLSTGNVYVDTGSESTGLHGNWDLIAEPIAFGFGWTCEDKSILAYPEPEPLDIEPQEPPPAYLNGISVPAYDNIPLDWMGALTLVDSVVNGVKGLGREFANVSSGGDLGQSGNSTVNEANQAAKSAADPTSSTTQANQNAAQGNTLTSSSQAAPADPGGSVDDYDNKVDGLLSDLQNRLGDNNLSKLAALLAELAKKFPHLQKLIMSALEAMLNGQFGLLLSVCKQILGMNIDDPLIAQIKELCNSNVTDFYGTAPSPAPGVPGELPSTEGNVRRIIDVLAEAQLADNEVLASGKFEPMEACVIDE